MTAELKALWYFAYGSNMSAEKFSDDRGIKPLGKLRTTVPGWVLTMSIPGLPYQEPSFSSVRPRAEAETEEIDAPDVVGLAYLITKDQYRRIVGSEGGGIAYRDIELQAEVLDNHKYPGKILPVRTLAEAMSRSPPPRPSRRYMKLLLDGVEEAKLPSEYQQYLREIPTYQPPSSFWAAVGAKMFIALFGPIMLFMEIITHQTMKDDGTAPRWVIWLVRSGMMVIWSVHDYLFAPVFGRGDGMLRM
ncbi:hypothetical protein P171DRAFT_453958 [Karstenula rhodostoma CBS 690.94]|uniref:gamma-glutamylcyclotransferase n=1 Tax=Karstenula rhodostoma CBS 690.94 TaxID=1392251 RepID=A0A9P4PMD2_9PLEO|nr:hypothetical protein P171DRAFT_453958 [Karstenula rhodostoma CBS 690.94]